MELVVAKVTAQMGSQLMPDGVLVTSPVPVPAVLTVTSRVVVGELGAEVAHTSSE
jgi:hypothetical protein